MLLTFAGTLQFQAPGGSNANQSFSVPQATYTAQTNGSIDIAAGTTSGVVNNIPLGPVATAMGLMLKSIGFAGAVYFNGQTGGSGLPLHTGGIITVMNPQPGAGGGVSSCLVITNRTQVLAGQVDYLIFGD